MITDLSLAGLLTPAVEVVSVAILVTATSTSEVHSRGRTVRIELLVAAHGIRSW
jgi:hypothetical protein